MSETATKQPSNIIIREDGYVVLKNVRLSYANLFKPRGYADDEENVKYSVSLMLDKETHAEAIEALQGIIKKYLSENKAKLNADKLFLKDGDMKAESNPEYAGHFIVSASNAYKPSVLDQQLRQVDDPEVVYSGCYANVLVRPWWQDNKYGKRVNCSLSKVQKVADGERFGGAAAPADDDWTEPIGDSVGDDYDPFGDE